MSEEEVGHVPGHEGRKADMSPAAGAAMRAVLAEMGKDGSDAAAGVGLPHPIMPCTAPLQHVKPVRQIKLRDPHPQSNPNQVSAELVPPLLRWSTPSARSS